MLTSHDTLRLALDPGLILRAQGIEPDPWQEEYLLCPDRSIMLNCCRGAGKSRTTSAKALHHALFAPKSLTLLISRAQRQAQELLRYVKQGFAAIGRPVGLVKETETQLEFANGARVVSLPGRESTIRSFQGVTLLIIDEAARVPDELYASVSPMTAIANGQQILISTPFGQRGFFYREWHDDAGPWRRFAIPWQSCPRHTSAFIQEERRKFGEMWVGQEYECSFTSLEGRVYPDFEQCLVDCYPALELQNAAVRFAGGLDWGWSDPFVAVWGFLDKSDVLHVVGERYKRQTLLHEHIKALRDLQKTPPWRETLWFGDPSGRTEMEECRAGGLKVLKANNEIRLGIMAVTARVRTGRLKVYRLGCPNLIAESQLYRYPSEAERQTGSVGENPVDENNHAMDALRYLVAKLDARFIGRLRRDRQVEGEQRAAELLARDPETAAAVFGVPAPAKRETAAERSRRIWTNSDAWQGAFSDA